MQIINDKYEKQRLSLHHWLYKLFLSTGFFIKSTLNQPQKNPAKETYYYNPLLNLHLDLTDIRMMKSLYEQLIDNNRKWVAARLEEDEEFFTKLAKNQNPPLLWIGCADSRVPANQITGTNPGEVFVHRNIANMVIHSDLNMLSVLDYAVNILEVEHVIVCGHYECGGVKAAMGNKQFGLIDNWLRHIKDVYRIHNQELNNISDSQKRLDRFVELNVIEQVYDLGKTSIIQNAWRNRKKPELHGWVYDINNGLIKDLNVTVSDNSEMEEVYKIEEPDK